MYVIKKGNQFFSSGGGYVNSGGACDSAKWVNSADWAWGTTSLAEAQNVARVHGGQAVPYK